MKKKNNIIAIIIIAVTFISTGILSVQYQDQQFIFLVRHAEKIADGSANPKLDSLGKERALRLAIMLSTAEIGKIYSTNYNRTISTGEPLAKMTNKVVQLYQPKMDEEITRILSESKGENLLIIGHSNTIPSIVNYLIGKEKYTDLDDSEYGKLFIVAKSDGNVQVTILNF